jgi:hypothetical protein
MPDRLFASLRLRLQYLATARASDRGTQQHVHALHTSAAAKCFACKLCSRRIFPHDCENPDNGDPVLSDKRPLDRWLRGKRNLLSVSIGSTRIGLTSTKSVPAHVFAIGWMHSLAENCVPLLSADAICLNVPSGLVFQRHIRSLLMKSCGRSVHSYQAGTTPRIPPISV